MGWGRWLHAYYGINYSRELKQIRYYSGRAQSVPGDNIQTHIRFWEISRGSIFMPGEGSIAVIRGFCTAHNADTAHVIRTQEALPWKS